MAGKKLSRNAPCPCGSGKKYKNCCYGKDFDWVEDDDGSIHRSIPMSDEVAQLFQDLRQAFVDKHGRQPGPDDPLFSDMPHPEHLEHMMVQDMKEAGVDPAFIYAFEKTGLLVTEDNQRLLPDTDLADWNAAIEQYHSQYPDHHEAPQYPIGTVAHYGPDGQTTTKIVAGVFLREDAEPIMERWLGTDVVDNPEVHEEMKQFFEQYGVQSVMVPESNMGCPHEEGEDFPAGQDCPFCPYPGKTSPEAVRSLIEKVSPGPYFEMYGRKAPVNGLWTVYGNEVRRRRKPR